MCSLRLLEVEKTPSHDVHGNCSVLWTELMCLLMSEKVLSQKSHCRLDLLSRIFLLDVGPKSKSNIS